MSGNAISVNPEHYLCGSRKFFRIEMGAVLRVTDVEILVFSFYVLL